MSLFGDYVKERNGDSIIEDGRGFATYRLIDWEGRSAVYIVDIYVAPLYRNTDFATSMANEICKEALRVGCQLMIGTVSPTAQNSTDSIKVLLAYGMKLEASTTEAIVFKKEI